MINYLGEKTKLTIYERCYLQLLVRWSRAVRIKKDYGDIDLILQHQTTGNYLLVEAKNHALPLDVYFRSHKHTEAHLERTKDWERKVAGRLSYLARHSSEIGITNPYK